MVWLFARIRNVLCIRVCVCRARQIVFTRPCILDAWHFILFWHRSAIAAVNICSLAFIWIPICCCLFCLVYHPHPPEAILHVISLKASPYLFLSLFFSFIRYVHYYLWNILNECVYTWRESAKKSSNHGRNGSCREGNGGDICEHTTKKSVKVKFQRKKNIYTGKII